MPNRLNGKVAIVTGSGRGIGRAIAQVFGREGASVLAVDRDAEGATRSADSIVAAGGTASAFVGDVSNYANVLAAAQAASDRYGGLDILAQNAGIYPPSTIENMTDEQWDLVLGVNLKSVMYGIRACIPHMRKRGGGRVVVTSSITGPRVSISGFGHYAASKAGVNGLIKTAALELAADRITVNGIEPGSVMTEGMRSVNTAEGLERLAKSIPLGALAEPEDIAYAYLFLASDEAKYITGQTIIVDGGQILPEVMIVAP